jgi:hypothetical protein
LALQSVPLSVSIFPSHRFSQKSSDLFRFSSV